MLFLLAAMVMLPACSAYQLRGVVVEGKQPGIYIVDNSDPRLNQVGVADANIDVVLDPDKLRSKNYPTVYTDDFGRFALNIDEPGAGVLEYSVSVYCNADGYAGRDLERAPLPASGKQILIVLSAGRGTKGPKPGQPDEDLIGEVDKFKKQFD